LAGQNLFEGEFGLSAKNTNKVNPGGPALLFITSWVVWALGKLSESAFPKGFKIYEDSFLSCFSLLEEAGTFSRFSLLTHKRSFAFDRDLEPQSFTSAITIDCFGILFFYNPPAS